MKIPKYGIVRWYDACGASFVGDINTEVNSREDLPIHESIGQIFFCKDGTVLVLHDREMESGIQKKGELTAIPKDWVNEIIALEIVEDVYTKVDTDNRTPRRPPLEYSSG